MKRKVKIKYYNDVQTYGVFLNHTLIVTVHSVTLALSIAKDYNPVKIEIDYRGRII